MKEAFDNDHYFLAYVTRPTVHDKINVRAWLEGVAIRLMPYFAKRMRKEERRKLKKSHSMGM